MMNNFLEPFIGFLVISAIVWVILTGLFVVWAWYGHRKGEFKNMFDVEE